MHLAPRSLAAAVAAGTMALGLTGLPSTAAADADIEAELLRLINVERVAAGLEPLVLDPVLAAGAATWSAQLAEDGSLSHDPDYTVEDASSWGENVGYTSDEDAAARLHELLMESPEHRANILDPSWTVAGVGVVVDDQGRVWLTQRFAATTTTTPVAETLDFTTTLDEPVEAGAAAEDDAPQIDEEAEAARLTGLARARQQAVDTRSDVAARKLAELEARLAEDAARRHEQAGDRPPAAAPAADAAQGAATPPARPEQARRPEAQVAPQPPAGPADTPAAARARGDAASDGQAKRGR